MTTTRRSARFRPGVLAGVLLTLIAVTAACTTVPPPDPNRPHVDQTHHCQSRTGLGIGDMSDCLWSVPDPTGQVVLIGDSNAGHFAEGVIAAGNGLGFDVRLWTSGGCPFGDLYAEGHVGVDPVVCRSFVTDSVAYLQLHRPSLVVMASATSGYLWTGSGYNFRDPVTNEVTTAEADKARLWQVAVASVARQLNRVGIPVVMVHTAPRFMGVPTVEDRTACGAFGFVATDCSVINDRSWIEGQQRAALVAEHGAIAQLDAERTADPTIASTVGVDFTDDLCDATICSSRMGDHWNYLDNVHLSVDGAVMLTPRWLDIICTQVADGLCASDATTSRS